MYYQRPTPSIKLDHSIKDRPLHMTPMQHEYFQAVLVGNRNGLRIWDGGRKGLTLEILETGEKAQLTWY